MYIQSFWQYEINFGDVTLPKHHYTISEIERGKKNIVEVTDEQFERIQKDKMFQNLLEQKKYRILNNLPFNYRTSNELLKEKNDEILKLQEELKSLKNMPIEEKKEIRKKKEK